MTTVVCLDVQAEEKNRPGMGFHHFPEDKKQRPVWIQAIKGKEGDYFAVRSHTTVSSEHFDP